MRLVVDLNRCQGFAQCVFLAQRLFALHGEEALLFSPRFDEAQRDRVEKAAAACPVQAMTPNGGWASPPRAWTGTPSRCAWPTATPSPTTGC
ncbi:ferredoxin [Streptomyces sp. NPDC002265]|uniref:ferredoxin n=1 Tax=Streptomyces sp. NPDC002265 TaxID=3154415 RepID=UPI003316CDAD